MCKCSEWSTRAAGVKANLFIAVTMRMSHLCWQQLVSDVHLWLALCPCGFWLNVTLSVESRCEWVKSVKLTYSKATSEDLHRRAYNLLFTLQCYPLKIQQDQKCSRLLWLICCLCAVDIDTLVAIAVFWSLCNICFMKRCCCCFSSSTELILTRFCPHSQPSPWKLHSE